MATLHMDVESVTTTNSHLRSTRETIEVSINALTADIESMVGATWIAPGATQFQTEYYEWLAAFKQLTLALGTLSDRLNSELTEWKLTASEL